MCLRICPAASKQAHAEAVDAGVVADGGEILHALAHQRANQIFGDAAEPEAADHDGGAVENIADGFVGIGDDLIHAKEILTENRVTSLAQFRTVRKHSITTAVLDEALFFQIGAPRSNSIASRACRGFRGCAPDAVPALAERLRIFALLVMAISRHMEYGLLEMRVISRKRVLRPRAAAHLRRIPRLERRPARWRSSAADD